MAKSKIIVEIANGEISTEVALKRTKILLQELNDDRILAWINSEIEGYPDGIEIPQYRKITGTLRGSYFKGSMATHMKYTNVPLSLGKMPNEIQEMILITNIVDGIEALRQIVTEGMQSEHKGLVKSLPADIYPLISEYATMEKQDGRDWQRDHLLSLAGVYSPKKEIQESSMPLALKQYLADHPEITTIVLRLDNDYAGRLAATTLKAVLPEKHTVILALASQGKDYNDMLKIRLGLHQRKEVYVRRLIYPIRPCAPIFGQQSGLAST